MKPTAKLIIDMPFQVVVDLKALAKVHKTTMKALVLAAIRAAYGVSEDTTKPPG